MLNHRKAGLIACAMLTLTLIPGCFKESYPRVPVKDITRFSLGSAHFTPFKKRPKAKELYDKMVQLYESFSGVELTYKRKFTWKYNPDIKEREFGIVLNYRTKLPCKFLQVFESIEDGNRTLTRVVCTDGKARITYSLYGNAYCLKKLTSPAISTKHDTSELIPIYFFTKILKYDLLPDKRIKGEDVYVLKLSVIYPIRNATNKKSPAVYMLYVAKSDLLPRKAVFINDFVNENYTGPETPIRETYTYSGIVANPNLPDSLFDTRPPKDAKREK